MSRLIALVFDDEFRADEARIAFRRMAAEGIGELAETAVISVNAHGQKRISQDTDVVAHDRKLGHVAGIVAAAVTGTLPFIAAGTAAGWLVGRLRDNGVTDKFLREVGKELTPRTSALIVLGQAEPERRQEVLERLRAFRPRILQSDLPPELEREYQAELDRPPAP